MPQALECGIMSTKNAKWPQNMSAIVQRYPAPIHPDITTDGDKSAARPFWQHAAVKVGAMANTSPYKPFWNPAFVGAVGLIFILVSALVAVTISWQQTKNDVSNLTNEIREARQDNRDLKKALDDEKDYTRDAIDQITRDLNVPAIRPKK